MTPRAQDPGGRDFNFAGLHAEAWDTWVAGGWAMIPIAITAAVMFGVGATGLRKAELAPFARDLKVMKVCVATGPLLGLLGTVTGMLATFGALASGSGGDQTMAAIAKGISEALITTETGLVVALPGLFFHYQLSRSRDRYEAFLAHLETVCTQHLYRRLRDGAAA